LPFPKQKDIEIPLLAALDQLGGEAKPRDVYPIVAASFPDLTPEEQEERLENTPSTRRWWNLVQWVRQTLVEIGEIDGSTRGVGGSRWSVGPGSRPTPRHQRPLRNQEWRLRPHPQAT
jgi:restriction system protein